MTVRHPLGRHMVGHADQESRLLHQRDQLQARLRQAAEGRRPPIRRKLADVEARLNALRGA